MQPDIELPIHCRRCKTRPTKVYRETMQWIKPKHTYMVKCVCTTCKLEVTSTVKTDLAISLGADQLKGTKFGETVRFNPDPTPPAPTTTPVVTDEPATPAGTNEASAQ